MQKLLQIPTGSMCYLRCRVDTAIQLCGCKPFFYPFFSALGIDCKTSRSIANIIFTFFCRRYGLPTVGHHLFAAFVLADAGVARLRLQEKLYGTEFLGEHPETARVVSASSARSLEMFTKNISFQERRRHAFHGQIVVSRRDSNAENAA